MDKPKLVHTLLGSRTCTSIYKYLWGYIWDPGIPRNEYHSSYWIYNRLLRSKIVRWLQE